MGLYLGYDGKLRAMKINTGRAVPTLATLYVGLLQSAPSGMDGLSLASLISAGQGNEFTINANFYSARKLITFGAATATAAGATCGNDIQVQWSNTSGSTQTIAAAFITDAASGGTGEVLWCGSPDAGAATILNGNPATVAINDFVLTID